MLARYRVNRAGVVMMPPGEPGVSALARNAVTNTHHAEVHGIAASPGAVATRRVIPVTSHARPRALQYKATMTRTKARCSAALWVFARSATAKTSCTE